ncbi:MAG: response regulator [Gemmatimonadetes bacterium]|nr:response regulator [Gemmatimonadota bacterium]
MGDRILFVDDEPRVLDGLRRQLRNRFEVRMSEDPEEALKLFDADGPFAVVVSDMRMPGMNGAQFLSHVREKSPDTVRMILSGQSDLDAAIAAVNDGSIFRFLTKPCPPDQLTRTLELGLHQYRLVAAEKELLDRTLSGSIQLLTDVLGLAQPEAFSRARRLESMTVAVAEKLAVQDVWEFRLAAMLSQIGCVALPPDVVARVNHGEKLAPAEATMFAEHPAVAARLLRNIPRLHRVADMVEGQRKPAPAESIERPVAEWGIEDLGAQTLRAVAEFDRLLLTEPNRKRALGRLQSTGRIPAILLAALEAVEAETRETVRKSVTVSELAPGMVLAHDVECETGMLLAREGQEVTDTMISRLRNFVVGVGVKEPIEVLVTV